MHGSNTFLYDLFVPIWIHTSDYSFQLNVHNADSVVVYSIQYHYEYHLINSCAIGVWKDLHYPIFNVHTVPELRSDMTLTSSALGQVLDLRLFTTLL